MLPGAFGEAVIERQGHDIEAEIGGALHVAVAAENVGAVAEAADIAGREQKRAARPHRGGAGRVLGLAHRPDQAGGPLLGHFLGDPLELSFRYAGDPLDLIGGVFLDLLAHLVHSIDTLRDELLVFPAILENVPEDAPDRRDIGAWTLTYIFGGMRGGAGQARIDDDKVRPVELLAFQQVL